MSSERGNLIIVSAASGSGKSTLVDLAIARLNVAGPEGMMTVARCVTCTTRKPRGQERHKGGTLFAPGDALDRCLLGWLAGAIDRPACQEISRAPRPPLPAPR